MSEPLQSDGSEGFEDGSARGSRAVRRRHGAYYTSRDVAEALVEWAVAGRDGRLLDPSAGGGVFLESALAVRARAGLDLVPYGIELDGPTLEALRSKLAGTMSSDQFRSGDFFSLTTESLGKFSAIVGNPPYIRHHYMTPDVRSRARARIQGSGIPVSDRADLWALFVVHALSFLADTGRLALVLPGSILQADYASAVVDAVRQAGGTARLIRVQELLFPGVQERSVVLTVDRDSDTRGISYMEVRDTVELRALLVADDPPDDARAYHESREDRALSILPREIRETWARTISRPEVSNLKQWCSIRIGLVTGANSFFIRTKDEVDHLLAGTGLSSAGQAIVSRSAWLNGLSWTDVDAKSVERLRSRLLVLPKSLVPSAALRQEIDVAEEDGIHLRSHCSRRTPWWSIQDLEAPDLMLPYMGGRAPSIVQNEARSLCTNAVHRLTLMDREVDPLSIAISSRSALFHLSAELVGRQYGGGVLKFELADASLLKVVTSKIAGPSSEFARFGLETDNETLESAADELVLRDRLGLSRSEIALLRRGAEILRSRRTGDGRLQ